MLRKIQPGAEKFEQRSRARKVQAAWQGRAEREDGGRRDEYQQAGG